jgi:hypothetical protein
MYLVCYEQHRPYIPCRKAMTYFQTTRGKSVDESTISAHDISHRLSCQQGAVSDPIIVC